MKTHTHTITREQLEKALGHSISTKRYYAGNISLRIPEVITLEIPDEDEEKSKCLVTGQHCYEKGTGHTCKSCCFCFHKPPSQQAGLPELPIGKAYSCKNPTVHLGGKEVPCEDCQEIKSSPADLPELPKLLLKSESLSEWIASDRNTINKLIKVVAYLLEREKEK